MTITIQFWAIPLVLVIVGIIGCYLIGRKSNGLSYDFITPLFSIGWLILFIVAAVALVIGKYVF